MRQEIRGSAGAIKNCGFCLHKLNITANSVIPPRFRDKKVLNPESRDGKNGPRIAFPNYEPAKHSGDVACGVQ